MLLGRIAGLGEPEAAAKFRSPNRIQTNILAGGERALLDRLCRLMPDWVTPDQLTAVGMLGAVICGAGYIASNWRPGFLFLASLGLLVNWFGDSLDGSLARHRKVERARYGYFLDHSVDAISLLILMAGLGFSPYVRLDVALFALGGYYLLSMYAFLSSKVSEEFPLTFLFAGPTEFRFVTICFNLLIYIEGRVDVPFMGVTVSLYTLLVGLEGAVFVAIYISDVCGMARKLRRQDESSANWRRDRSVPNRG
jgi:phosphatidylglycerophosphate synthase